MSRERGRPDRMSMVQRSGVSVVIPTLNRGGYLEQTVRDLLDQDFRPLEVLIVDQSPIESKGILELQQAHPDVISYHHVPFRGLPPARNFGWQKARYDHIVFVDDDVRCKSSFVSEHRRSLEMPGVGVVAGGVDELSNDRTGRVGGFSRWLASPQGSFGAVGERTVSSAKGCNFAVRRDVLREACGFDERLNVGAALHEETEFCLRVASLGYRVHFNGRARVLHLAAPTGGCRVKEPRSYVHALLHNRGVLVRRHLSARHYPTALGRLALLALAYARANRDLELLKVAALGWRDGYQAGGRAVLCSRW